MHDLLSPWLRFVSAVVEGDFFAERLAARGSSLHCPDFNRAGFFDADDLADASAARGARSRRCRRRGRADRVQPWRIRRRRSGRAAGEPRAITRSRSSCSAGAGGGARMGALERDRASGESSDGARDGPDRGVSLRRRRSRPLRFVVLRRRRPISARPSDAWTLPVLIFQGRQRRVRESAARRAVCRAPATPRCTWWTTGTS